MESKYSIQLFLYPEQEKSIERIIIKYKKHEYCAHYNLKNRESYIQYLRLKRAIGRYDDFISYQLCDKHETDPLKQIAETKLIMDIVSEDEFIKLMQRNSLTNRIAKACEKGEIPAPLITRIRECMVAYKIYKASRYLGN